MSSPKDSARLVPAEKHGMLPYWVAAGISDARSIWLSPAQVVEYTPNAEAYIWLKSAKRAGATLLVLFIALILVNYVWDFLTPLLLFLGHTFLSPLKPLLVPSAGGDTANLLFSWLAGLAQFLVLSLGVVTCGITFALGLRPTHIGLLQDGLYIVRHLSHEHYQELRYIHAHSIQDVRIRRPEGRRSVRDFELEFVGYNGPIFTFRWGDVYTPEERAFLLSWMESHLPNFDSETLRPLRPPSDRQSYTELWLQELSAPPKRDKLTPLSPGSIVNDGKYRVVSKIGVGGQGTVYLAIRAQDDSSSEVVLKEFVLPIYPDPRVRRQAAEKFQEEAEMLRRLDHPCIVDFLDLFIEDHRAYLVLERIEGDTLEQLVAREGKLPEAQVVELARKMCDILDYLHSNEPPIVHRDFTPDNLILEPSGDLKLIDFSVAQRLESNVTGSVVGKPSYIAPEQFRGKPVPQSDLYSLGATLYFLLTAKEPEAISRQHPAQVEKTISNRMDEIVSRLTHLDATRRFQSAREVSGELQ